MSFSTIGAYGGRLGTEQWHTRVFEGAEVRGLRYDGFWLQRMFLEERLLSLRSRSRRYALSCGTCEACSCTWAALKDVSLGTLMSHQRTNRFDTSIGTATMSFRQSSFEKDTMTYGPILIVVSWRLVATPKSGTDVIAVAVRTLLL